MDIAVLIFFCAFYLVWMLPEYQKVIALVALVLTLLVVGVLQVRPRL